MTEIMEQSDADYFKIAALSKSQIKNWNHFNPLDFWHESAFNPNKAPELAGDYVVTGKLFHMMLLQRELVDSNFEVNDELGKSRINKKWQAAQLASAKLLISSEELDRATKMVDAISKHEILRTLLSGLTIEKPFTWHDKEWDIPCKMRLDGLKNTSEGIYVFDYKTTSIMGQNISYIDKGGFQYDIGFYSRGIQAKYGQPLKKFIFIFQSTKEGEEHLIRLKVVEGPHMTACEIATDLAVRQIVPRIKAWQSANSVICAETDAEKYKAELEAKEAAMLKCWLPYLEAESWEVSPWFDRALAEDLNKGEISND